VTCTVCSRPVKVTRRSMCGACYERRRHRDVAYGRWQSSYIDAAPVRLHVKTLQDAGVGLLRISALTGVNRRILQRVTTGPSPQITRVNAAKLLAVSIPDAPHHMVAGRMRVDATGTIRRCQALVAFGYTRRDLAKRLGVKDNNVTRLFRAETGLVCASTAQRVENLFNQLQLTPGTSSRARNEGRRKGWLLPFDWDEDEIDHLQNRRHRRPRQQQTA